MVDSFRQLYFTIDLKEIFFFDNKNDVFMQLFVSWTHKNKKERGKEHEKERDFMGTSQCSAYC